MTSAQSHSAPKQTLHVDPPLISCVMPTYGRPQYVNEAVWMFLLQDYPLKELIILNDCPGQVFTCDLPADSGVRVINHLERYPTLGEKRNASIELATGDLIAVWDDDDVYLPWRLSFSLAQMREYNTPFYRAAEFWAYWGVGGLHHNQSVPGWVNHPNTLFTKSLWETAGGYPAIDVGEDASLFNTIHQQMGEFFITYPVAKRDRFFILRGKSQYPHLSIRGGAGSLDTRPGEHRIAPTPIADPVLRGHYRRVSRAHCETQDANAFVSMGSDTRPVLSVCVSLKNRSWVPHDRRFLPLFPNAVEALADAASEINGLVELVVADFNSDDAPLGDWIHNLSGGLLVRVIQVAGGFSRGRGLNEAASAARSHRLLLTDADVLINSDVLRRSITVVNDNQAWVPIFSCLDEAGNHDSWLDFGHGIVALSKRVFAATGGVPEFESWGGEDNIFNDLLHKHVQGIRERHAGLRHQWHPEWCRDQYYGRSRQADYNDYIRSHSKHHIQATPIPLGPCRNLSEEEQAALEARRSICLTCSQNAGLEGQAVFCRVATPHSLSLSSGNCRLRKWPSFLVKHPTDHLLRLPKQRIPKLIHQVWVGGKPMPDRYLAYRQSWKQHHPGWEMRLWHDGNLPPLTDHSIYQDTPILSMKSDLLRYEVLAQYGGVYVDTDFECFKNIESLLCWSDVVYADELPGQMGSAFLASTPNNTWIKALVGQIYVGYPWRGDPVNETGPTMLQRVTQPLVPRDRSRPFYDPISDRHAGYHLSGENGLAVLSLMPWLVYPYWMGKRWKRSDHPDTYAAHHWAGGWK